MSERRPFCLWVTPTPAMRGSASYALSTRYATSAAAQRALDRDYPTGRTPLGATVAVGRDDGTEIVDLSLDVYVENGGR